MTSSRDLSVVVSLHREGRLVRPALRSLGAAIAAATDGGITTEVILVLGGRDARTRGHVDDAIRDGLLAPGVDVRVIEHDDGDLALSRNRGVRASTGAILAISDGADLVSANWLIESVHSVRRQPAPVAVHPAYVLSFGTVPELSPIIGSDAAEFNPAAVYAADPWPSCVVARRSVFDLHPYGTSGGDGVFDFEDWRWNAETLAAGIPHLTAARTVLYRRSTPVAHTRGADHPRRLVAPNALFRDRRVATAARQAALADVGLPPIELDDEMVADWQRAHETDPTVAHPKASVLDELRAGRRPSYALDGRAAAYWQILGLLPEQLDAVFVVPWVVMGGADRLLVHYIEAVRRAHPDWNVAVLTTLAGRSTHLHTIPDGVTALDIGEIFVAHALPQPERITVLADLLVQLAPALVHTINATLVLDMLDLHGQAVSARTNVFLSAFSVVQTAEGEVQAPLVNRSADLLDNVAGVLTDNSAVVARLCDLGGLDPAAFHVHHSPAPDLGIVPRDAPTTATRFLWAGRFDQEKRLDVVAEVAERLRAAGSPAVIHVYGTAVLGNCDAERLVARLQESGAVVHPPYTGGITSLPLDEFAGVLLTSDMEGVPIILLEAAAAGLAMVAPQVGGVPEIVRAETGWPVSRTDAIDEYVDAIGRIITDRDEASKRVKAARLLLDDEYSQEAFERSLLATPGYLSDLDAGGSHG